MKYGILGDIHANLEALEAVLDEMEKQGVEKHVSVGDLVGYGANLSSEHQTRPPSFMGHSHVPVNFFKRKNVSFNMDTEVKLGENTKIMVNVGSIGQPRDENPDAVCVVYDSDEQLIRVTRVRYDVEKAARKIVSSGLPEILAERLKYGR